MLAHHAMPKFQCRANCRHKECQRHAPLGLIDQRQECKCMGEMNASSVFLENVLDLTNTLAQIMILCGIHECKAKAAIDVVTYAFLHYDQVCFNNENKKRLRKEDLFQELGRRTLMNRVEAQLAYTIIKRGFKAFYYTPKVPTSQMPDSEPVFSEECVYVHAAKKTAEGYGNFDGISCEEQRGYEAKIKVLYKKFYDRMQVRKTQPVGEDCNCCFCAKKRDNHVYAKTPPCGSKKKEPHKCPHCCQKKQRKSFIHSGRVEAKCPVCHRSRRFCTCEKYKFSLDWVKSIWDRPDFDLYYKDNIDEDRRESIDTVRCSPNQSNISRAPSVVPTASNRPSARPSVLSAVPSPRLIKTSHVSLVVENPPDKDVPAVVIEEIE